MAFNNSKSFLVDSVSYAAVTTWATATAKTVGQLVRQTAPSLNQERVFMCVVAGTTHATTEPTWNTSRGDQTTDNTVTWLEVTGNSAICGDITNTPNWTNGSKALGVSRGHIIKNDAATHLFICTTSGTGHSTTEPTWNTTTGATTADNSVTWTCIGAVSRYGKFEGAAGRVHVALNQFSNLGGPVEPNLIYVADSHAETQSTSSISWSNKGSPSNPIDMICIDKTGNVPPTSSADLKETASVTTTGSNVLQVSSIFRVVYGIIFSAGTSANIQLNLNVDTNNDRNFEKCKFRFGSGVGSGAQVQFARNAGRTVMRDCEFKWSNTGQGIVLGGNAKFENCLMADGAGSIPSILLQGNASGSHFELEGCDLSTLSGSTMGHNNSGAGTNFVTFNDCKFPASWTPWQFNGGNSMTGERVVFNRCSSAGDPVQFTCIERSGTVTHDKAIYRGGGAEAYGTPFSFKAVQTTFASAGAAFTELPVISIPNSTVSGDVSLTCFGIINAASLPTNVEAFMEAWYLASGTDTQATRKSTRVADFVTTPSAYSADTVSGWDLGATARANSQSYAVGDIIKTASNPDRIFFCTSAGTSAGSEPGGYASAVDGGSVTDSGATFRAGMRFKMELTLTSPQPALAGFINLKIRLAKPSATWFIDPAISVV